MRACEKLGYTCLNEVNIKGFLFDIWIPEKKIVIEFNGPSHYLNNSQILMGSSLYKHRLVQDKYQYKVISFSDYKLKLLDKESKINISSMMKIIKGFF